MESGDTGVNDLDRLIQTCEFENQQFVKLIEKENQLCEALDKEMEEKSRECLRLEEAINHLDEETKRAHKQFTLNRDNCESLRKTMVVLMEHEVALNRKLNGLITNGEGERTQHEGVVKHYETIYNDYMTKYKTFPYVKDVLLLEEEIAEKEKSMQDIQERIDKVKAEIEFAQGGTEVNFRDTNSFITKLAEVKVDTMRAISEKTQIEKELNEIQTRRNEEVAEIVCDKNQSRESIGDDVSAMIGMFHNESCDERNLNTNNSADPLGLQLIPIQQAPLYEDGNVKRDNDLNEDVPIAGMSSICIQPDSEPDNDISQQEEKDMEYEQVHLAQIEINMQVESETSTESMQSQTTVTNRPVPQSPMICTPSRAPQQSFGNTLHMPQMSRQPQPLQIPTINAQQPMMIEARDLHSSNPPQSLQVTPRLTPKIKHGVSSLQSPQLPQIPHRAPLLMPRLEQPQIVTPRMPVIAAPQIRAPPKLPCPMPPRTPESNMRPDPIPMQRFISPVSQVSTAVPPRHLYTLTAPPTQLLSQVSAPVVPPKLAVPQRPQMPSANVPPKQQFTIAAPQRPEMTSANMPPKQQFTIAAPQKPEMPSANMLPKEFTLPTPQRPQVPSANIMPPRPQFQLPAPQRPQMPSVNIVPPKPQFQLAAPQRPQMPSAITPAKQMFILSTASTPHTSTPVTSRHFDKQSPDQFEMSNREEETSFIQDVVMQSPDKVRASKSPRTPGRASDMDSKTSLSKSPFDLEKHLQRIQSLSKSPGRPMYSHRPMFEAEEMQIGSPGPFMKTFNVKSPSAPASSSSKKNSPPTASNVPSEQPMMNLFGTQQSPETAQSTETNFLFGAGNDKPEQSSFMNMFGSDKPEPSPFMNMFGSNFTSPNNSGNQESFTFNFGQEDSPQSSDKGFSFSFGNTSDNDKRSPSVFSLF